MSFTHDQLKELGYFVGADGSYSRIENNPQRISHAKPKRNNQQTLVSLPQTKERSGKRSFVRIARYSCRPLDIDNFAGGCKPLIDQLRYTGIIADDNPETIQVEFVQVKVAHKTEERTEVEIKR